MPPRRPRITACGFFFFLRAMSKDSIKILLTLQGAKQYCLFMEIVLIFVTATTGYAYWFVRTKRINREMRMSASLRLYRDLQGRSAR